MKWSERCENFLANLLKDNGISQAKKSTLALASDSIQQYEPKFLENYC